VFEDNKVGHAAGELSCFEDNKVGRAAGELLCLRTTRWAVPQALRCPCGVAHAW